MNALTVAELRLKHAQLTERAERLETKWRTLPPTAKAIALGKEIKALREQAADYGELLAAAAHRGPGHAPMWHDSEDRDAGKAADYCLCEVGS